LGLTIAIAAPIFVPLYQLEYAATQGKTVIWAPITLFIVFMLCLPSWLRHVHRCPRPWSQLGLNGGVTGGKAWFIAFAAGWMGVVLLYGLQLLLGWSVWVPPNPADLGRNLLAGLLVGVGVGLAEEIIFRGWLLFELEQDYRPLPALWLNAGLFAIAHYLRPLSEIWATWPQFVGLLILGAALVWARRIPLRGTPSQSTMTTLGPAAGLHGGLVFAYYQVDVNDLVSTTGRVPEWVTGIGGNPLAGLLGLGCLGVIAYTTFTLSRGGEAKGTHSFSDRS
jgi:membrane protease YdiL (CAAX protease family)